MRNFVFGAMMLAPLAACHQSQAELAQACFGRDARSAIAACSAAVALRGYSGTKLSLLYVAKGENELHIHDAAAAVGDLGQAVAIDSRNALAYYHRSYAYRALHDQEHALADLDQALDLDPESKRYRFARGEFYLSERRTADAIADYDQILAKEGSNLHALQMKAVAYSLAREPEKAIEQINTVLLIAPNLPEGLAMRCLFRGTANIDASLALTDCDRAVAMKPNDPKFVAVRARVRFELGQAEGAMADAKAALKLDPHQQMAMYVVGLAKGQSGDSVGSKASLTAAHSRLEETWFNSTVPQ
ncbi:tetratricopeptide repeat protein [Novosphingobium terrae]|uniref:tetratricopeptide repeat protein n=1 Tax=Novosphingobium terrae TaxID=2726189 RepID=UPI00197F40BA|nr:tetratricopeptide repeat protein [Novosphingobium terrae]